MNEPGVSATARPVDTSSETLAGAPPNAGAPPSTGAPPDRQTRATAPARRLRIVMSGALLAMVLAALDQNIVNTALPRMAADLGGMAHLSWVVTAFMVTATTTTPLYGKLSDIYGRRTLFFVAILIFLGGSLLRGAAESMAQIIAFRAIQGLGAGGLLVLAQAAIGDVVSPRDRPRYQGLFTGTFALASVAGPLLGGLITSGLSWRWVFYVNLPVGLLALTMIAIGLRKPPSGAHRPIDYVGALLLAGAISALLLLLAWGGTEFPWASLDTAGLCVLTATLIGLFIWRETRAPEPLIRLPLFRKPVFARGVAVGGMMTFAMLGSTVFLPVYFQLVLGMDPARSGVMMLPQVIGMLLSSVIGGRIVTRIGRNKPFLLAGLGLEAVALGSLVVFAYIAAPPSVFLISMAALGLGMGMGMPNLTTAVQNAVEHRELGAATGAMTFVRSLGGALGVAASGSIMSSRLALAFAAVGQRAPTATGSRMQMLSQMTPDQGAVVAGAYRSALTGCFLMSGVVMTLALLLVLGLPEITLRGDIEGAA